MQKPDKIISDLLIFYKKLLVPFMKIRRDMPFPTEPQRMETDGEHSFTLAMVALSLNERLGLKLDSGLIAQYALVHDLVEVHAGDLSVKAQESDHAQKEAREHESYQIIKQDFAEVFPWLHQMIEQYEAKSDEESRFVYVVDKLMGALGWLAGDGKNWRQYYPDKEGALYHQVVDRLREKVKRYDSERLLELFELVHAELEQKREEFYNELTEKTAPLP